uniref:Tf2-1-like SH3-like domain-containing protein n=1 Tax=Lactuca sativa TaxID=4236 RepID=A0A9R1VIG9_LACSA|nr:hypothetical protein LSAT_V11C500278620 [Lactuca sativa]
MPFLVLYGRDPPHLVYYGKVKTVVGTVEQYLEERDRMLQELKRNLLKAQQQMKTHADGYRRNENFAAGDRVYLKLRPYQQRTVARQVNEKLAPRYFGPFEVLEKIGLVAYRLLLPNTARIHNVFHVSQLKHAIGNRVATPNLPAILTEEMEVLLQPEVVEGVREGGRDKEVLTRWQGLPEYEATWEEFVVLNG